MNEQELIKRCHRNFQNKSDPYYKFLVKLYSFRMIKSISYKGGNLEREYYELDKDIKEEIKNLYSYIEEIWKDCFEIPLRLKLIEPIKLEIPDYIK